MAGFASRVSLRSSYLMCKPSRKVKVIMHPSEALRINSLIISYFWRKFLFRFSQLFYLSRVSCNSIFNAVAVVIYFVCLYVDVVVSQRNSLIRLW